jgi:hypothetical protein
MRLTMALIATLLTVGLSDGPCLASSADASGPWHVTGTPSVISQEIQFTNAGANLVGTVYLGITSPQWWFCTTQERPRGNQGLSASTGGIADVGFCRADL